MDIFKLIGEFAGKAISRRAFLKLLGITTITSTTSSLPSKKRSQIDFDKIEEILNAEENLRNADKWWDYYKIVGDILMKTENVISGGNRYQFENTFKDILSDVISAYNSPLLSYEDALSLNLLSTLTVMSFERLDASYVDFKQSLVSGFELHPLWFDEDYKKTFKDLGLSISQLTIPNLLRSYARRFYGFANFEKEYLSDMEDELIKTKKIYWDLSIILDNIARDYAIGINEEELWREFDEFRDKSLSSGWNYTSINSGMMNKLQRLLKMTPERADTIAYLHFKLLNRILKATEHVIDNHIDYVKELNEILDDNIPVKLINGYPPLYEMYLKYGEDPDAVYHSIGREYLTKEPFIMYIPKTDELYIIPEDTRLVVAEYIPNYSVKYFTSKEDFSKGRTKIIVGGGIAKSKKHVDKTSYAFAIYNTDGKAKLLSYVLFDIMNVREHPGKINLFRYISDKWDYVIVPEGCWTIENPDSHPDNLYYKCR